jgi:hypothetical protein
MSAVLGAAREGTGGRERIVEPGAVRHCPRAVAGHAQHREHGGPAQPLRVGHRLGAAQGIHKGFLDLVLG